MSNTPTIAVGDEAKAAMRRKPPTIPRIAKFANSNDEKDMPKSWEVRWMAAVILEDEGYDLVDKKGKIAYVQYSPA